MRCFITAKTVADGGACCWLTEDRDGNYNLTIEDIVINLSREDVEKLAETLQETLHPKEPATC